MEIKIRAWVYHGFEVYDQHPFFEFEGFLVQDTVSRLKSKISEEFAIPEDLMLFFSANNSKTQVNADTKMLSLITQNIYGKEKVILCFGLRRCRKSIDLVSSRRALKNQKIGKISIIGELIVKGLGSDKIILQTYIDGETAEGVLHMIELLTGLPRDNQILLLEDKQIIKTDNSSSILSATKTDVESIIVFVVATLPKENKKMENICREFGIKHLKAIKLKFLTKEEELNPKGIESIKDIKNYVYKTHNVPYHHQSILHHQEEIHDDKTKIFNLFERNPEKEIHFNVIITKKPFNLNVEVIYGEHFNDSRMVNIRDEDTIADVKMKIIRTKFPTKAKRLVGGLQRGYFSRFQDVEGHFRYFNLILGENVLEDEKTVEEYKIGPTMESKLKLIELIFIRFHFEKNEETVEYCMEKQNYHLNFHDKLKQFRKEYKIRKKDLRLPSDYYPNGAVRKLGSSWKIHTIHGNIVDYIVKRQNSYCLVM